MKTEGKNTLFDIVNALFTDLEMDVDCPPEDASGMRKQTVRINGKEYINSLTKETAKQNIFMINRRLAINYPLQAQCFNNSKVNASDVLKFWSDFLYTGGRVPGWVYAKGAVKSKETKNKAAYTSKDLKEYAKKYNISTRDLEFAKKMFPDELESEIVSYKKFIEQLNKIDKE